MPITVGDIAAAMEAYDDSSQYSTSDSESDEPSPASSHPTSVSSGSIKDVIFKKDGTPLKSILKFSTVDHVARYNSDDPPDWPLQPKIRGSSALGEQLCEKQGIEVTYPAMMGEKKAWPNHQRVCFQMSGPAEIDNDGATDGVHTIETVFGIMGDGNVFRTGADGGSDECKAVLYLTDEMMWKSCGLVPYSIEMRLKYMFPEDWVPEMQEQWAVTDMDSDVDKEGPVDEYDQQEDQQDNGQEWSDAVEECGLFEPEITLPPQVDDNGPLDSTTTHSGDPVKSNRPAPYGESPALGRLLEATSLKMPATPPSTPPNGPYHHHEGFSFYSASSSSSEESIATLNGIMDAALGLGLYNEDAEIPSLASSPEISNAPLFMPYSHHHNNNILDGPLTPPFLSPNSSPKRGQKRVLKNLSGNKVHSWLGRLASLKKPKPFDPFLVSKFES